MKLTDHFSLAEFTRSATADRLGIDNKPSSPDILLNLTDLAALLEQVRALIGGKPVVVTSGYRCPKLNVAVGSRTTSDHVIGKAADIVAPGFGSPLKLATLIASKADALGIGQVILERIGTKEWVHVSTRRPEKDINRIITIADSGVKVGIV